MRKEITVTAEPRESRGKNEARRLRVKGLAPAVLYGSGSAAVAVSISPKEINRILHSKTGHNTIFNLAVQGGEDTPVMIVDWQSDPVKENLLHVDLKRIDLTKRIAVKVPRAYRGRAEGREAAGRIARSDHARGRDRVSAGRYSGVLHGGRDRTDDRPEPARERHSAGRIGEAGESGRSR